jgi:UDP-N-acetylglucosamine--N-acetylmuramyl-(pentapeptide) pyrophosphoryl-undecaprenol N-acetylglucosamine transferase
VTSPRALRVLFVANDGFSVGHVMRTLAIARALSRRAAQRSVEVRTLLATTSEAHSLLAAEETIATVRLPAPLSARRAGFSDPERRHLVRGTIEGIVNAFGPDLIVVDTFPSGPHGELATIGGRRRVLVRRSVPDDPMLTEGLAQYDMAIVADDPLPSDVRLPIPQVVRVPPITLTEPRDAMSREQARAELGLPADGRVILVASGGGGDVEAVTRAQAIATCIEEVEPGVTVTLALGPLARGAHPCGATSPLNRPVLAPFFAAFDGAIAPAGYNTAHELAKAGVPTALFAQPRPFDDQSGRAARFSAASLACARSLRRAGRPRCAGLDGDSEDRPPRSRRRGSRSGCTPRYRHVASRWIARCVVRCVVMRVVFHAINGVGLGHVVRASSLAIASADDLLAKLRAMPRDVVRRVRALRLFLSPDAGSRAASAVPEAHALRRFFSELGATVVPPPELMRWLSDVPAGAPATGMIEPTNLCNLACPTCPTGTGKIKPLPQMTLARFDHVLDALGPTGAGRMRNLALWSSCVTTSTSCPRCVSSRVSGASTSCA